MSDKPNHHFFRDCLRPARPDGDAHWADFLARLAALGRDPRLLWYPSSGNDYRDLLHLHPARFRAERRFDQPVFETAPDVYVHTDYHPWLRVGGRGPIDLFDGEKTRIRAVRVTPLVAPGLGLAVRPELVVFPEPRPGSGRIYLVDAEVESTVLGRYERTLLYVTTENVSFFLRAVLARGLRVHTLVNIRDGAGCGGGGHVNFKFLWFFLGLMGAEYLVTDNMGRHPVQFDLALAVYPELRAHFERPENRPVLLEGRAALPWSQYGRFQGDAHVYRVMPFDAAAAGDGRRGGAR